MTLWVLGFLLLSSEAMAEDGIARGEAIFKQRCSVGYCHGQAGAAARGPRLRDRDLDPDAVYRAIREGVPKTAMPAFQTMLKDEEIRDVASYVMSVAKPGQPVTIKEPAHPSGASKPAGPEANLFTIHCRSCHTQHGAGVWLAGLDKPAVLRGFATSRAKTVKTIKLKDGDTFPGRIAAEKGDLIEAWDLTDQPPIKRTLERAEIESITPAVTWKHPKMSDASALPAIADYVASWK
ncbi:MAG: c-type cytochrome [Bryobacteraceae bacterium]